MRTTLAIDDDVFACVRADAAVVTSEYVRRLMEQEGI
jgi:hypothetical protein